jgi:predicted permease
MHTMSSIVRRLLFFFRRHQFDRDLADELRFHEEMTARALADADGLSADEAQAAARRRVGNPTQLRERSRDAWTFAAVETFAQDVRHALRLLRRDPTFTVTALATLALGIGLTTAIFSVAYGLLWRPLPYPEADRLVAIQVTQRADTGVRTISTFAPASYEALRRRVTTFDQLAAYTSGEGQLTGRGEPQQLRTLDVSPNFFATLGVTPARGRAFLTGAAAQDDDRSAVVTDRLWRGALMGDPAIVGQSVTIDGVPRTVVGVLPPDFSFRPVIRSGALPETDIFLASRWPADSGRRAFLWLLGRLTPAATRQTAATELTALANDSSVMSADALAPEGTLALNGRSVARAIGFQEYGTGSVRLLLLVLLGAVAFVLLIACVNVANLQMARLTSRRGELSVRMALGAGRRRIVRQLLTEAVVLSLLGASLGVLLAQLAVSLTLPLVPPSALPRLGGIAIDGRVLLFCLGLACVSTLVIGLVPALRVGGVAFGEGQALHGGEARTTGDGQGERMRTLLVAAQIAMTLVLLIGAGLLIHSFLKLTSVSPGFESSGRDGVVQTVKVMLPARLYDKPEGIHAFARGVLERTRQLPGVTSASVINSAPFGMMYIQLGFELEGRPKPTVSAGTPKVEPGYFKTMGIPLLAGRDFTASDTALAPKVAIVTERIVREYLSSGPGDAIGRRVRIGGLGADGDGDWLTVVGVVADVRQQGLDRPLQPMIYVPFQQERSDLVRFVAFVARTNAPAGVLEGIRAEIRRAAPDLPIQTTSTMDEAVSASVAPPRFRMWLLAVFAITATLIATCGIYGLMAYAVTQRRREIGVRMALGAERRDVLRLVLGHALRIVVAGLVAGLVGAVGVTRVLQRFLFGVTPTDPLAFTVVTLLLLAVGLMAAWVPARRAVRIDPTTALRAE